MDFGSALELLKQGERVARKGWNGKDMFLVLIAPHQYNPDNEHLVAGLEKSPWVALKTADRKVIPWSASQSDMLANDWVEL
ncbi:DUF2829 domain-containing protein [Bacillus wiedmannii]|uniref:DUF2829 domain-containing protein n=1 Tax=Bacillus wiedmannii TaxID=1890302 RepID=UPI000BF48A84|nr:DUF2829 domain-containing protein [Bacillus wiedmannii]PGC57641.1 hypothetical protein COM22_11790 [Bacillus wiedmannii]